MRPHPNRRRAMLAAAAVLVMLPGAHLAAAPGGRGLDGSFGEGGGVVTSVGAYAAATAVAVQRDGKLVVAGATTAGGAPSLLLARYLEDGDLDSTFGVGGVVVAEGRGGADAVVVQGDGAIVVAAPRRLLRFLPDGSEDASFGGGEAVRLPEDATGAYARLLLQPDGRIVVVTNTPSASPPRELVLLRFRPDGTPDPAFGRGGTVRVAANWAATAAALAPDGTIVVAGSWMHPQERSPADRLPELVASRFGRTGALDATFGRRGLARHGLEPSEAVTTGVAVQRDGSILVGGRGAGPGPSHGCCGAVWRLRPDGSLDRSFGYGGKAVTGARYDVPGGRAPLLHGVQALALDRGGRIVVTSLDEPSPGSRFGVARFTPAGRRDARFGAGGGVSTSFGGTDRPWALALRPDGRIVVAGSTGPGPWLSEPRAIALARYLVPPCVVPQLRARTERGALTALRTAGCAPGPVRRAFSAAVPRGRVVAQGTPPLARLPEDAAVAFVVSRGPRP